MMGEECWWLSSIQASIPAPEACRSPRMASPRSAHLIARKHAEAPRAAHRCNARPGRRRIVSATNSALWTQILDVLDCSGSGDVDTSTEVDADGGAVVGVFGERLVLNPTWVNPSGAA